MGNSDDSSIPGRGAGDNAMRPLCFVLLPSSTNAKEEGRLVDFDAVYRDSIGPAVSAAEMEPVRSPEEREPKFEDLMLCPYAIVDLTVASADTLFWLGVRYALRPATTVVVSAGAGQRLPFDAPALPAVAYDVDSHGRPSDSEGLAAAISQMLRVARAPVSETPGYQFLEGLLDADIKRLKTDVFRDRVPYSEAVKAQLATARQGQQPAAAVRRIHLRLRPVADKEAGVAVDLLLSYREVGDTEAMIALVDEMAPAVAKSVLVQEQLAFALNREGRDTEAEAILRHLISVHGPSSETFAILGRTEKDRWKRTRAERSPAADAHLDRAIDAYRRGFEADWRDAFPGVNAVTLLELQKPGQEAGQDLARLVAYAARRRVQRAGADYWDHATLLELAVVSRDGVGARDALAAALALQPAVWMRESTAGNLGAIAEAREEAGEDTSRLRELIDQLGAGP